MNIDILLQNADTLITTPQDVAKLRQLILALAVQGKLVPQDAGDEPVDVNYLQYPNSFNIELPKSWGAVQIGKYCDIEGGSQPPKDKFISQPKPGYVRMYQIRDLGDNPVPVYIPIQSTAKYCYDGDILIGRYGASVGKIFWARNGTYNVALAKFIYPKDIYESNFVFLLLKSTFFQSKIKHISRSAQAGFNKGDIADIYIPLPPLAEQRRIVARVDALMALVDQLEAQQAQASALGAQVLDAVVGGV